jgi:very-short-patch-repair endonuclease
MVKNIVRGQSVDPAKHQFAKELRQQMTPAERKLWAVLRTNQLGGIHFRRQQVIKGFIVDFYCHSASVCIEVDGGIHETQKEYDAVRTQAIESIGLRVIRFTNDEVINHFNAVLQRIQTECVPPPKAPSPLGKGAGG